MARTTTITLGGDLEVGRIGFGAMRLTGPNLWGEYPDRDGGIVLLRQAVEAGVTLIDTADLGGFLMRSAHDRSLTGIPPHAAPADVDGAVAAARRAFDEGPWPRMSPQERRAAGMEVARRSGAGWMSVNGVPGALDGAFGGYKSSGIGREFGATGLAQYIEYKTIAA
jgi:hypothetical protein